MRIAMLVAEPESGLLFGISTTELVACPLGGTLGAYEGGGLIGGGGGAFSGFIRGQVEFEASVLLPVAITLWKQALSPRYLSFDRFSY